MRNESRRSTIETFHVMDVWKAARERAESHGDVLSLAAGQPSTPAPAPVLACAERALRTELLGYTETFGIPALRREIARYHRERYDIEVGADDVVVTTGSSGAFTLLFLAAFDVGDTVALARPGYPAYRNTLAALGCRVAELDCGPATRYQPTVAMLDALDPVPAGVIVASPANPTGTVIDPAELAAIARWCDEHDALLISDEIYHGIEFGGTAAGTAEDAPAPTGTTSPATSTSWATSRSSVVVGSVSKYFSMTGWRLGWILVPESLRPALQRLGSNMTVCPPAVSQYAALGAFGPEARAELDGHVARYRTNRDILLRGLRTAGITGLAPADGAFYAYADVADFLRDGEDSTRWASRLLADTGVAIAPGIDFDTVHGDHTVRMSFAGATEDVTEAVARLGRWLAPS